MSGSRVDPFNQNPGVTRGTDSNVMASLAHSWELMAKQHCSGRNQTVATILGYCVVIHHLCSPGQGGGYTGAEFQIGRDVEKGFTIPPEWQARLDACTFNQQKHDALALKFTSHNDAHHAPCRIHLNGESLGSLIGKAFQYRNPDDGEMYQANLDLLFGAVDRLPTIFNESDSHAEKVNLKAALLGACTTINLGGNTLNHGLFLAAHQAAFERWLAQADVAFAGALASNQEKRKATAEGSYDRLYRDAKIAILEYYRLYTASERPVLERTHPPGQLLSSLS